MQGLSDKSYEVQKARSRATVGQKRRNECVRVLAALEAGPGDEHVVMFPTTWISSSGIPAAMNSAVSSISTASL
jgi:hypothetical protein